MRSTSDKRRFEFEALEPRLFLSADPSITAVATGAAASAPAVIDAQFSPEAMQAGLAADSGMLVEDIYFGLV